MDSRKELINGLDTLVGEVIPNKFNQDEYNLGDNERVDIGVEMKEWLRNYILEREYETGEVETNQISDDLRRYVLKIKASDRSFIIAIHDPMGKPPNPLPTESATGGDYIVEYPVKNNKDRFVLVQTKRSESGHSVPPKQLFAMGGVYMFGQYLTEELVRWSDRFVDTAEYASKADNLHNEFMFVKYAEDELYVPISSALSTHDFRTTSTRIDQTDDNESGEGNYKISNDLKQTFVNEEEAREPFYDSFDAFQSAVNDGDIGLKHEATDNKLKNKLDSFAHLADILNRPNIALLEVEGDMFERLYQYASDNRSID
jgi:hypothetical protein